MKSTICIVPGCSRRVKTRGLCGACYEAARHKVEDGEVTWAELEAFGLAIKPIYKGRPPGRSRFAIALARAKGDAGTSVPPEPA